MTVMDRPNDVIKVSLSSPLKDVNKRLFDMHHIRILVYFVNEFWLFDLLLLNNILTGQEDACGVNNSISIFFWGKTVTRP